MYVFPEPTDVSFSKVGISGKIFPSQHLTDRVNFILVSTETGHETTIIEHECDFCYFILDGSGYFEVEGDRENCAPGSLVVIPAGKKFTYKGKLQMLLATTPAWNEAQEETLS